jgi:hypothetical protein
MPPRFHGAFCPNGERIAVYFAGTLWTHEFWYEKYLASLGISVAPNTFGSVHGVKAFDTTSGEELAYFPDTECAAFSHDGHVLALANGKGRIELWNFPVRPARLILFLLACTCSVLTFAVARRWKHRPSRLVRGPEGGAGGPTLAITDLTQG